MRISFFPAAGPAFDPSVAAAARPAVLNRLPGPATPTPTPPERPDPARPEANTQSANPMPPLLPMPSMDMSGRRH